MIFVTFSRPNKYPELWKTNKSKILLLHCKKPKVWSTAFPCNAADNGGIQASDNALKTCINPKPDTLTKLIQLLKYIKNWKFFDQ